MKNTTLEANPATAQNPATTQNPATAPSDRASDYTIYKPNSRGTGGVIRFGLNRTKGCIFVDAANQSGEKQFDWDHKITMKWGLQDLGAMLATLQGKLPQAKLFHQSEKSNSAFELTLRDDSERPPYLMSLSRQDALDKTVRKVTITLTHGEAAVLEAAFHAAVARVLRW